MTGFIIDWQAWATFGTGILAVGAAIYVGRKQMEIQNRQAGIQDRLAGIEELKLRQALFDDRFEVYDATRAFLAHIVAYASVPGLSKSDNDELRKSDRELQQRFMEELDRSSFLFRPSVRQDLVELWKTAVEVNYRQKMQKDPTGRQDYLKHVDGEHEAMKKLQRAHASLAQLFGDELTLSAHGATFAARPDDEAVGKVQ